MPTLVASLSLAAGSAGSAGPCGAAVGTSRPQNSRRNRSKPPVAGPRGSIRRSLTSGDGQLGADGTKCLHVGNFAIVLRCGSFFVPDTSTADPTDAVTVDEDTPVATLVSLANQLCEMASCPDTNQDTCADCHRGVR